MWKTFVWGLESRPWTLHANITNVVNVYNILILGMDPVVSSTNASWCCLAHCGLELKSSFGELFCLFHANHLTIIVLITMGWSSSHQLVRFLCVFYSNQLIIIVLTTVGWSSSQQLVGCLSCSIPIIWPKKIKCLKGGNRCHSGGLLAASPADQTSQLSSPC